jgi:hypothetical protein
MPEEPQNQMPNFLAPPPWAQDSNRIDVNLIAMLLWQALLVGTAVAISHLGWYLPDASPGEMGLQYGLITFGFLCASMVLFHVGGVRDSLAMRAEFAKESQTEKWMRSQMRLQQRKLQKETYWRESMMQQQQGARQFGWMPQQQNSTDEKKE